MIKIGIIGGAGYTAGELIRILVNHPEAKLVFVHSTSNAGNYLYDVHAGLLGDTDMKFCDKFDLRKIDLLFLCSGHGKSSEFWGHHKCPNKLKIIDLAQDYRDESAAYIYGLPELQKEKIQASTKLANPGCFATAIQLALLPLADAGLINSTVNITAITGSTGAGVKPSDTTHFSWRSDNISSYKVFNHQHLIEIKRNISKLQPRAASKLNFVPLRGDFSRGIFVTAYMRCSLNEEEAISLYKAYYHDAAFTFISEKELDLKQVVNTNKCLLNIRIIDGKIVVTSVIDNLLKGASGQAVQNMNLMFGLAENTGLKLKASAF